MAKNIKETYYFNCMVVRALLDKFSEDDRLIPSKWLEKLSISRTANREAMRTYNTYVWKLLLDLQCKKFNPPFDKEPNEGELTPLAEDVIKNLEMESSQSDVEWTNEILQRTADDSVLKVVPTDFLNIQPSPKLGAVCYAAVFGEI